MIRVVHVIPSLARSYGGPTQALAGYLEASRSIGIHAEVAAPAPPRGDRWFTDQVSGALVHAFPSIGRNAAVFSPGLLRWLARNGAGYDVVHIHGILNPVSTLAATLCAARGWPYVIRPFGMLSEYTFVHRRGAAKKLVFRLLDRRNLARAAAVHFTTEGELKNAAWQRIDLPESYVVPPPATFPETPSREPFPHPTVLFLSRLHPVKHVELLLESWKLVTAELPDARLMIAGDGAQDYRLGLEELSRRYGTDGSVEFLGFVDGDRKAEILARSRLFVLPSRHENLGISVLEAIAAGLPVIITPQVQIADLVEKAGFGMVVDRNAGELARSIVKMLNGEVTLTESPRRIGEVRRIFSVGAVGSALRNMYAGLLLPASAA